MPNCPSDPPSFAVRAVSRSDVGMRRATNQDAVVVAPNGGSGPIVGDAFLMVADGMGAHAAGELASKMATDTIPHAYLKAKSDSAPSSLRRAIRQANEKIHEKGCSSPEFQGMGTTCSCLVLSQGSALVGHVGDSRVYRLRDGVLEQLTFDHSLVWEMAAASKVSEDKVPACIPKNVITRSLGPHESVMVDLEGPHELKEGDIFLLCSDGLTGVVDDPLTGSLLGAMEPDAAADALVNIANLRGGPDNISVVIARVECASSAEGAAVPCATGEEGWRGVALAAAASCFLACGWFLMQGRIPGMLASAVGLGAALAYLFSGKRSNKPAAAPKLFGGVLGNGPYRRVECGDHAAAAGDLRDLVRELSELRSDEDTVRPDGSAAPPSSNGDTPKSFDIGIDWEPLQESQQAADGAFERGDFTEALVRYVGVVGAAMDSLRHDDGTRRYEARNQVIS